MIKFLEKKFIKSNNLNDSKVREKYGLLGGILGIICNVFLFILKLVIGISMASMAIMSDAFNNMSDTFSSIVGIVSAKIANKRPDKDHPFGHGRIEYIATLIVSFVIILVGVELLTSSFNKVVDGFKGNPTTLNFSLVSIIILSASLLVKLWMWSYNNYLGKKINSSILLATAADSISDVLTSAVVIVSTLIGYFLLPNYFFLVDGGMGAIVSVIICINGLKIVLSTINDLLGKPATREELDDIEAFLLKDPNILGVHDLMIHDYGPGRKIVTVHCEVDAKEDVVKSHEVIDALENKALNTLNMQFVIHMDPIDATSEKVITAKAIVEKVIKELDPVLKFHDLRITDGKQNINVIFDLVCPFAYTPEKVEETIKTIRKKVKENNKIYNTVIKIDYD